MGMIYKEVRLVPSRQEDSVQLAVKAQLDTDVRSTVESQFRQMEQAHDRIRAEELTARLADQTNH